jgi:hypothetical protein
MSKFVGYSKSCLIDLNSKSSGCEDKYNNIQTTCKQQKVFVSEDSKQIKEVQNNTPSYNNIMSSIRDTTIDYNYFRASRTTQ